MAYWKSLHHQRGWVKAHEAKEIGRYSRRADDKAKVSEGLRDADEEKPDS